MSIATNASRGTVSLKRRVATLQNTPRHPYQAPSTSRPQPKVVSLEYETGPAILPRAVTNLKNILLPYILERWREYTARWASSYWKRERAADILWYVVEAKRHSFARNTR